MIPDLKNNNKNPKEKLIKLKNRKKKVKQY